MNNSEILEAIRSGSQEKKSTLHAWILLGISLLVFGSLGAFAWELEFVILLTIAIFIHELGHLLAMKIYGYKNLKMMFLPFIGGAASGESEEEDAYKIAMISLFGPFIGFLSCLLSAVIGIVTREGLFFEYAYLALFLNAFNLLPIMPLDGGHFLNETLLSRYPKVELLFRIMAVLGLCYLSYRFSSWVLGIIAIVMFFSMGASYQMAKVARNLRLEDDFKSGGLTEEKVARMRESIAAVNSHFEKQSNSSALPKVIGGIWIRINKSFPSMGRTVFLLAAYFAVAIGLSSFTWGFIYGSQGSESVQQADGDND